MLHDVDSKDSLCEAVSSLAHTNHQGLLLDPLLLEVA